jgi:hypothetical protein
LPLSLLLHGLLSPWSPHHVDYRADGFPCPPPVPVPWLQRPLQLLLQGPAALVGKLPLQLDKRTPKLENLLALLPARRRTSCVLELRPLPNSTAAHASLQHSVRALLHHQ